MSEDESLEQRVAHWVASYEQPPHTSADIDAGMSSAYDLLREQQARIAELERDLDAARGDAERYRYIKHELANRDVLGRSASRWWISSAYMYGDTFDAAIDLARARGEGA